MNNEAFSTKISFINSYLLAAIFFTIPIKVGPAYVLSGLTLLLWLYEGDLWRKWCELRHNLLVWAFLLYFIVPFVSLIWSQNFAWGLSMASRGIVFLFFPLYLSVARKDHVRLYLASFIASVSMTEMLSYYNWFQLHFFTQLPPGIRSGNDGWQIAPFVNHIMYNPILAFCTYLLGHAIFFEQITKVKRCVYWFFLVTMSVNMLISGGRSGQIGFFVMMLLLIFQRFARRPLFAGLIALGVSLGVFATAYEVSDLFRQRTDLAIYELIHYQQAVNTSVGLRINFAINTLRMFAESPLLGVGVGDYPIEYARINAIYTPQWGVTFNPHNQYLFDLSTAGLLGGVALFCLFFLPLHLTRNVRDEWFRIRAALTLLFLVICLGESYLWRSNTGLMFVLFHAILFAAYSKVGPMPYHKRTFAVH